MIYKVTAIGYRDAVKFYVEAEDIKEAYKKARIEAEAIFRLRSDNPSFLHPDPNVHVDVKPDMRGQFTLNKGFKF